jgi:hypothetical protein
MGVKRGLGEFINGLGTIFLVLPNLIINSSKGKMQGIKERRRKRWYPISR